MIRISLSEGLGGRENEELGMVEMVRVAVVAVWFDGEGDVEVRV